MSLEGRQLGEFEILEKLGQGGMGAVYKARQSSLRRTVALKTLQSSLAGDADYISRFRQEAVAAAALNHSNLVQVISAGESEGVHWFAMEYVEGESAEARLRRDGRLDPVEAIAIVMHVATALGYGWRKAALIHRDIKPDNIFLSGDGEVKLGDLGLAKSVGQAPGLTSTGAIMGTPYYISPEQLEAQKDVDLRADIYSLGCTLYHLLCGQPPYVGNSAAVIMMKHMSAPVPDLRTARPECPAELAATVEKMMQKLPADRQQNYVEVIEDLHRAYDVLSGVSPSSVVPETRKRAAVEPQAQNAAGEQWSALPAARIVSGVIAGAALAALLYLAPWKRVGAPPETERHEKQRAAQNGTPAAIPARENTGVPVEKPMAVAPIRPPEVTPAPTAPEPIPQPLAATTPAAPVTPAPATPGPSTPAPPAAPKAQTEVEKWVAQVDGPQEEVFQKQVVQPFETGVADLRARYLAALDADIAKASAAAQLADALVWRTERQAFEKAQNVAEDAADTPAGVKTLREAFRQQLAKLDQDRIAKARTLLGQYDAILAKNQTLLTQHQHLDDALALKNKRDEIAIAWLKPSPIITVSAAGPGESGKPVVAPPGKEKPFVNSLGMTFVPIPITGGPTDGQSLLFGIWKTRVRDYEVFAKATKRQWFKPPFPQGPNDPVVNVSWDDAQAFCNWLTERERKTGKVAANSRYRLPSDHEWSCAVGIGDREDPAETPMEKSRKNEDIFPWGAAWPPPAGAGNYAGEELQQALAAGKHPEIKAVLAGYRDGFLETSPVGSFSANRFGLFDLGGNAWEWCEDLLGPGNVAHVMRGAAWNNFDRHLLQSSSRNGNTAGTFNSVYGFRCMLARDISDTPKNIGEANPGAPPQNKVTNAATSWSAPVSSQPGPNRILEVKLSPAPPAKVRVGQRVNLTYNYETDVKDGIGISVTPLMDTAQGTRPPGSVSTGGSSIMPDPARAGHGSATFYFIVNQPAHTQMVGLTMRARSSHEVLAYLSIPADYEFEGASATGAALQGAPAPDNPIMPVKEAPFVNSLGMTFVPVPIPGGPTAGRRVLFSIWETRVQDYRIFVKETKNEWPAPGFAQGDKEPAVNVSWNDAQAFCVWLTRRERQTGKIAGNEVYRLPSDHEWSCAVGIGDREDPAMRPEEKTRKIENEYPWGTAWPPPADAGNFSGEEVTGHETNPRQKILPGYRDNFPRTAPVGSFAANAFGLFDLAGNAMEWCEDWFDGKQSRRVMRSSSFVDGDRSLFISSLRASDTPTARGANHGFRCVLVVSGG
jgi:formylglycine-generating enzyme required for sulfatase activity